MKVNNSGLLMKWVVDDSGAIDCILENDYRFYCKDIDIFEDKEEALHLSIIRLMARIKKLEEKQ
jgi:hypothetical protein